VIRLFAPAIVIAVLMVVLFRLEPGFLHFFEAVIK